MYICVVKINNGLSKSSPNKGYQFSAFFTVLQFSVDLVYIELIIKTTTLDKEM